MCCFSQPVDLVSDTNIFARSANGRQFLVYSMNYAAAEDLAMVLPLPIPPNAPEDAVRFINLERYPNFFAEMRMGFPQLLSRSRSLDVETLTKSVPTLQIHDVGSFEASFVPRIADFDRLDERFRIPPDLWDQLPAYRDFGFAVFKLKGGYPKPSEERLERFLGGASSAGPTRSRRVHPMAFEFPRRNSDLLYFPTVHVHDWQLHSSALFDHVLYCQADPGAEEYLSGWEKSLGPASAFLRISRTEGIVAADRPCWRRPLKGQLENKDALVGKGGALPQHV